MRRSRVPRVVGGHAAPTPGSQRDEARRGIVGAANLVRQHTNRQIRDAAELTGKPLVLLKPLTMRDINRAVCIVRRRRLVKPEVLELAGFRP